MHAMYGLRAKRTCEILNTFASQKPGKLLRAKVTKESFSEEASKCFLLDSKVLISVC